MHARFIPLREASGVLKIIATLHLLGIMVPSGDVDTSQSGKLSLLVCKSLCDDTFSRSMHVCTPAKSAYKL